jgi:hypothetical protein
MIVDMAWLPLFLQPTLTKPTDLLLVSKQVLFGLIVGYTAT